MSWVRDMAKQIMELEDERNLRAAAEAAARDRPHCAMCGTEDKWMLEQGYNSSGNLVCVKCWLTEADARG